MLVPQVVYGYFPVNGDGDDLVVWTDEDADRASRPGSTTPASRPSRSCASPTSSARGDGGAGEVDYAAFHIVTMGAAVSEATAELFAENRYQEYLLLHGLGVEMAEALAEYWHHRIRTEWGFVDEDGPTIGGLFRQQYRGGRYSWGYPACPDLEDNATVAAPARRRAPRHRGERGDGLAVPARADHLGHHLPPPPGQVLRRPLAAAAAVRGPGPPRRARPPPPRPPRRSPPLAGPRRSLHLQACTRSSGIRSWGCTPRGHAATASALRTVATT